MSVGMEHAQEGLEHAHHAAHAAHAAHESGEHGHGHGSVHPERHPRQMAVVIAALAACLALAEMGEKAASSAYITGHVTVSDTYAFLQARNIRAGVLIAAADTIDSTPGIDAAAHERVAKLRAEADRLLDDPTGGEGRKQLLERAKEETELRDHARHRDHQYEAATGALQIAIVLASVSIVTRSRFLSYTGGALGVMASLFAIGVHFGLV
ncbi:MAG: DUF4337 family protein [Acetobacteraceae bacterium]|nr:DUF4337 family protein [Acetobacteraceae bacterium]